MRYLVSGLVNIETTLRVESFPIAYSPARYPFHGVQTRPAGVGYNLSKALSVLGNQVDLLSVIGQDPAGEWTRSFLKHDDMDDRYVLSQTDSTAQAVILYDGQGKRQINLDLKDIQDEAYPEDVFLSAANRCDVLILCNINFNRGLSPVAAQLAKPVVTDVHAVASLRDEYNHDFMSAATVLFMSDERLPAPPVTWAKDVFRTFLNVEILVIGMGEQGALLGVRQDRFIGIAPAVQVRPVVNTIGAGDALLSAFVHGYFGHGDPYLAIKQAVVFAAYKIGVMSAAEGFLSVDALEELYQRTPTRLISLSEGK